MLTWKEKKVRKQLGLNNHICWPLSSTFDPGIVHHSMTWNYKWDDRSKFLLTLYLLSIHIPIQRDKCFGNCYTTNHRQYGRNLNNIATTLVLWYLLPLFAPDNSPSWVAWPLLRLWTGKNDHSISRPPNQTCNTLPQIRRVPHQTYNSLPQIT